MAVNTKENDWIVATLNNTDYTASDFEAIGLTADNTLLLSKEQYKKSSYIQNHDAFKDDLGNFDDVKFDKFYGVMAKSYQMFANKLYENTFYDTLLYEAADPLRPDGAPIFEPTLKVEKVVNPLKLKSGISRVGFTDNLQYSDLSLAESSKVFNYAEGKFENYTPNDLALFESPINFAKSLASPLVMALWEDDGTHTDLWTGRTVSHKKGDLKTNELGNYYYETLDGRDPYGKRFRTIFDNITSENSDLNKYDFFDSNDLDKSTAGIVTKTAAQIAPLFIPGVKAIYGYMLLGSTLTDILPNLYRASLGVVYQNDDLERIMNSLGGFGKTLKPTISQNGQNSMLGLESLASIVSDVSLQWAEQRAIFKVMHKMFRTARLQEKIGKQTLEQIFNKLFTSDNPESVIEMSQVLAANKLEPIMKSRNRIAANVALGYMAMLQGLETYQDALAQGATKELAAMWTWGAVAGMYVVDKTGLGELFFPELRDAENEAAEKVVSSIGKEINRGFGESAKKAGSGTKGLASLFIKARDVGAEFWNDVRKHSTTFVEKAFAEGLEEVSEELCVDLAKATNNALIDLGWNPESWTTKLDAFENAGERYAANFLGGAVGGMVFAGVDLSQNLKNSTQTNQELIYLLRNGKKQDILKELERLRKNGLLGNTKLSARNSYIITNEDGSKQQVWNSGTTEDNQNEAAFKMITDYINALDKAIYTNGLNLSDSQVLDKLIMGDLRVKALLSYDQDGKSLMMGGFNGKFLQKWNLVAQLILDTEGKIQALRNSYSDPEKRNDPKYEEELNKLQQEKNEFLKQRDAFFNGTYSKRYLEETLFSINKNVNNFFFAPNFSLFALFLHKKEFDRLSPEEIEQSKKDYEAYLRNTKIDKIEKAFELFTQYAEFMNSDLGDQANKYKDYHKYKEFIEFEYRTPLDYDSALEALSKNDMSTLEGMLSTNMGFSVDGSITDDAYVMLEVPVAPMQLGENPDGTPIMESEDSFNERVKLAIEHNHDVINNVEWLILRISETGYIDNDIKEILKNTLGVNKVFQRFLNAASLDNAAKLGPKFLELVAQIKSETNVTKVEELVQLLLETVNKEFLEPVELPELSPEFKTVVDAALIRELAQLISNEEESSFVQLLVNSGMSQEEAATKYDELYNTDEDLVDLLQDLINEHSSIVQNSGITLKVINTGIIQATNDTLRNFKNDPVVLLALTLDSLTNSPLEQLISKLSINSYGKKLSIFEMLKREKGHLRNSKTITEYVMSKEATAEIELAIAILNMTEAVINAASTSTDGFGHFAIINDFVRTNLKAFTGTEYNLISDDNRAALAENIAEYRKQISILQSLSEHNRVNQFAEQLRVGTKVTKILAKGIYEKVKSANIPEIAGIKLTKGITLDILDVFDKEDATSQEIMLAATKLENIIYKNFREMVASTDGLDASEVFAKLLENVTTVFNEDSLVNLELSDINGAIESMTDYELFMYLTTILSQDRAEFNHYSEKALYSPQIKFAPLINLLISARIICAHHNNPSLFNTALSKIFGDNYATNMSFLDGIGGAGKTSVVARMVYEIDKALDKTTKVWVAGPSKTLVANLKTALGVEPDGAYEIAELLAPFLTTELTNLLKGFLNETITDKDALSELFTTESLPSGEVVVHVNPNLLFSCPPDAPNVIYVDEATHANTALHRLLAEAARLCGFVITTIGDLYQNGASNTTFDILNLLPDYMNCVRTSKLDISMRITNTLKKDNSVNTLVHMRNMDMLRILRRLRYSNPNINEVTKNRTAYQEALLAWETFKLDFSLLYFEDGEHLNGEKVVSAITAEDISKLISLKSGTENPSIGFVYDDITSDTYKVIEKYERDHPGVVILKFTPEEVQGSECDYFIIDTQTTLDPKTNDIFAINAFLKNFYTMITRSRKGTLYVDNGLTKIIKPSVREASTGESPDPVEIIKLYRTTFLEDLHAVNKTVKYKRNETTEGSESSETSETDNEQSSLDETSEEPSEDSPNNEPEEAPTEEENSLDEEPPIEEATEISPINGPFTVEDEGQLLTISLGTQFEDRSGEEPVTYTVNAIADDTIEATSTEGTTTTIPVDDFKDNFGTVYVAAEGGQEEVLSVGSIEFTPNITELDIPEGRQVQSGIKPAIEYIDSVGTEEENTVYAYNGPSDPELLSSETIENYTSTPNVASVRAYGWYLRDGCHYSEGNGYSKRTGLSINDDLNILLPNRVINKEQIFKYRAALNVLREVIQTKNWDILSNKDNLVLKTFADLGLQNVYLNVIRTAKLEDGEFLLKVSQFNEELDTPKLKQGLNLDTLRGQPVLSIVYRFETARGQKNEITVGILANPVTWEQRLNEAVASNNKLLNDSSFKDRDALEAYKTFYTNATKNLSEPSYYALDKEAITLVSSTRLTHVPKIPGDSKAGNTEYDYGKFMLENPGAVSSAPFIFSGAGDPKFYKDPKKLKGKPVAFVCACPIQASLKLLNGAQLTAANIAKAYKIQQSGDHPPYIRMMLLDPKSIYAFNTTDLFDPDSELPGFLGDFVEPLNTTNIETYGSTTTAAKILITLWNLRVNLMTAVKLLQDYGKNNLDIINDYLKDNSNGLILVNKILKSKPELPSYYMSGPMYTTGDTNKNGYQITKTDGKTITGYKMTPEGVEMALDTLDLMFKFITPLVPAFKDCAKDRLLTMTDKDGKLNSKAAEIAKAWYEAAASGSYEIKFGNGLNIQQGTPKDQVLVVLTQLIKIPMGKTSRNDYKVYSVKRNKDGKTVKNWEFDLGPYADKLDSEVFNGKRISAPSFITALFNLALHGLISTNAMVDSILKAAPGKAPYAYPTYTPFPFGFLYHSRYNKTNNRDGVPANFYEAEGTRNRYKTDAVVERGNFMVTLDTGNLKKYTPEITVSEDSEKAIKNLVNAWRKTNFAVSIEPILAALEAEALELLTLQGDSALTNIKNDMRIKYEKIIKSSINNHTLYIVDEAGNITDYVLSVDLNTGETITLGSRINISIKGSSVDWNYNTEESLISIVTPGNDTLVYLYDPVSALLQKRSVNVLSVKTEEILKDDGTVVQETTSDLALDEKLINLVNTLATAAQNEQAKTLAQNIGKLIRDREQGLGIEGSKQTIEEDVDFLKDILNHLDSEGNWIELSLEDTASEDSIADFLPDQEDDSAAGFINMEIDNIDFASLVLENPEKSKWEAMTEEERLVHKNEIESILDLWNKINEVLNEGVCNA